MTRGSKNVGPAVKYYLAGYSLFQCAGWSHILYNCVVYLWKAKSYEGLYGNTAPSLKFFQTLGLMEVVHCLVKIVPSSAFLTFAQMSSRILVVWGILNIVPEATSSIGVPMCLIAWCIAEVTRYLYYALNILNCCPNFLSWCRYSFFLLLYPTGVSGEILSMFAALPYITQRRLLSISLPNAANFSFSYDYFVILSILAYIPSFPQLFGHLLKQRKKVLHPKAA